MKIYRIENQNLPDRGLWYTREGEFKPLVTRLKSPLAELPMPFDPNAVGFFSGCDSIQQLRNWFKFHDLVQLRRMGFELFVYKSRNFKEAEGHLLFSKYDYLSRKKLSIDQIYNRSTLE